MSLTLELKPGQESHPIKRLFETNKIDSKFPIKLRPHTEKAVPFFEIMK